MTETTTSERHLEVPGATLTYEVRGDLANASDAATAAPPLLLCGSPMGRTGFGTLAGYFTDRVVVLFDPRSAGGSPAQHADDLHALVTDLGVGPIDVFASSGAAVNALNLVATHPDDLRILIAHEPPMAGLLPDGAAIGTVCDDIVATYDAAGLGPAMARFITLVMHRGEVDSDYLAQPTPDPAMFGLATTDDGSRGDALMTNMRGGAISLVPDLASVRSARSRVVIAVGEESGGPVDGEVAGRAAYAVAEALGQQAVSFPSGHTGFLGGEFDQTGKPEEFAARLREVMASADSEPPA